MNNSFEDWFNELQGFTLRSERFIDEAKHMDVSDKNIKRLIIWLDAAYNAGYEKAMAEQSGDSFL